MHVHARDLGRELSLLLSSSLALGQGHILIADFSMSGQELFENEEVNHPYSGTADEDDCEANPTTAISVRSFFADPKRRGKKRRAITLDSEESEPEQSPRRMCLPHKKFCAYSKRPALQETPNRYSSGGSGARSSRTTDDTSLANSQCQQQSSQICSETKKAGDQHLQAANPLAKNVDSELSVSAALGQITSLLNTVVRRVERVEAELKNQSEQTNSIISTSDSTPSSEKKVYVPRVVRVSLKFKTM